MGVTNLDLKATIMLHVDDLCELKDLSDTLYGEGEAVLYALLGWELTKGFFRDETELDCLDLDADAGLAITELNPRRARVIRD